MRTTRRAFVQTMGLGGLAAALGGCETATDALSQLLDPELEGDFRPPPDAEIDEASHVISRLTFGARPGEYRRVAAMGVDGFIEEQLNPDSISDRRCEWKANQVESLLQATPELFDIPERQLLFDLTRARLLRGIYSKRQLFEVMVDFWADHLNIFSQKGDCKWLKPGDERDVIRKHVFGNFRDLVRASSLSPAMLIYLDGHDNRVEHPGDRPNENYARELLELHTLGVHGGYTQKDVMEVARCLSGWTIDRRLIVLDRKLFHFDETQARFNATRHDDGDKVVLGQRIPSGGGEHDLNRVLDLVCSHASTAKHIAWKLCRRFIADPPPEVAVERVAAEFLSSEGDIKRTLRTLFATNEFKINRGNLFKRPMHFAISALRATDAKTDAGEPVMEALRRMGHAPYQYPTPDGYPIEELPWMGSLLWRWNFALGLEEGRIAGSSVDVATLAKKLGGKDALAAHLLGRTLTETEMQVVNESNTAIAMMLASPAFQRC